MASDQVTHCVICNRPIGTVNVEEHHLIPKTFGGRDTVAIHKMCHQKLHATFPEREMKNTYHTIAAIQAHPEMEKFIKWISKKDPSFYDKNDDTGHRKSRRKR